MENIKIRLIKSLHNFMRLTLLFLICVVVLRLTEWILTQVKIGEELNVAGLELLSIPFDIFGALRISSIVLIIHLIFSLASLKGASVISQLIFTLLLLIHFCFVQYFAVTLLPLGADLFGYSFQDIINTIKASGDIGWIKPLLIVALLSMLIFAWIRFSRATWFDALSPQRTIVTVLLLFVAWFLPWHRRTENFDRDIDFYVAENKSYFFLTHSMEYVQEKNHPVNIDPAVYPWLRRVNYNNALSQYVPTGNDTLNFVFLIVEGLGRDFTGPNAMYGGFTPFLDSLVDKSLYWTNFTSNAGRTFGALPSILGSLPYGTAGFMEYGQELPDHQTLASLLRAKGYELNFFYGGNSNFDKQDIFLEYNGFNNVVDQSKFPVDYDKFYPANSWGYPDAGLFEYAAEVLQSSSGPHLDVFLTLSTHEPFKVPDMKYDSLFDHHLQSLPLTEIGKQFMIDNREIFSCLLYTDNAIRRLFKSYERRKDFNKTVFIITGDHRLIPIPPDNKIKRFHVPLYINIPGTGMAGTFREVGSHSSIAPTILGMLKDRHRWDFPLKMPFISNPLSFANDFESRQHLALIRNKNDIRDYMDGEYFLSDDRLFKIKDNLELEVVLDDEMKARLMDSLRVFRYKSRAACESNRIDKTVSPYKPELFTISDADREYLEPFDKQTTDDQLRNARQLAFDNDYTHARIVVKNILNNSPNYSDARILLARTYAWSGVYDSARMFLSQASTRTPGYADVWCAWADIEFWDGHPDISLERTVTGLRTNPTDNELLARKARALVLLNRVNEAKPIIDEVLTSDPKNEIALTLKTKWLAP